MQLAIYMAESITMGRYPEDSNIIDFVEIKMLQLFEHYSTLGDIGTSAACWEALSDYLAGNIDIIFKSGEPYIINRDLSNAVLIQEDDLTWHITLPNCRAYAAQNKA